MMKSLKFYLVQLSMAVTLALPAIADDSWTPLGGGWSRYTNERFGTGADVPRQLFELSEPPPVNGDGREFQAGDGARLWVLGSYSHYAVTDDFQEYKNWVFKSADMDRLTYRAVGKTWLVLSGTKGDHIIYRKIFEGCGAAHVVRIEYPALRKPLYDPVVARVSRSLGCASASGQ